MTFQPLYLIAVAGIFLFLLLVFEALLGLRAITFKGRLHSRIHRYVAFALIAFALIHGAYALGTLVFGWF
jgi:hypothetical protein